MSDSTLVVITDSNSLPNTINVTVVNVRTNTNSLSNNKYDVDVLQTLLDRKNCPNTQKAYRKDLQISSTGFIRENLLSFTKLLMILCSFLNPK